MTAPWTETITSPATTVEVTCELYARKVYKNNGSLYVQQKAAPDDIRGHLDAQTDEYRAELYRHIGFDIRDERAEQLKAQLAAAIAESEKKSECIGEHYRAFAKASNERDAAARCATSLQTELNEANRDLSAAHETIRKMEELNSNQAKEIRRQRELMIEDAETVRKLEGHRDGLALKLDAERKTIRALTEERAILAASDRGAWERLKVPYEPPRSERKSPARGYWTCPDCGPHVKADEDGCCVTCGTDCVAHEDPPCSECGGRGEVGVPGQFVGGFREHNARPGSGGVRQRMKPCPKCAPADRSNEAKPDRCGWVYPPNGWSCTKERDHDGWCQAGTELDVVQWDHDEKPDPTPLTPLTDTAERLRIARDKLHSLHAALGAESTTEALEKIARLAPLTDRERLIVHMSERYAHCVRSGTHTEEERCTRRDALIAAIDLPKTPDARTEETIGSGADRWTTTDPRVIALHQELRLATEQMEAIRGALAKARDAVGDLSGNMHSVSDDIDAAITRLQPPPSGGGK